MKKIKVKNHFNNNLSTNIKLNEAETSKIIKSGGFLRALLSKLAGPYNKIEALLAKTISFP